MLKLFHCRLSWMQQWQMCSGWQSLQRETSTAAALLLLLLLLLLVVLVVIVVLMVGLHFCRSAAAAAAFLGLLALRALLSYTGVLVM